MSAEEPQTYQSRYYVCNVTMKDVTVSSTCVMQTVQPGQHTLVGHLYKSVDQKKKKAQIRVVKHVDQKSSKFSS